MREELVPIVERYVVAAIRYGESTDKNGSPRTTNRAYDEAIKALHELRRAGEDGRDALLELLKHDSVYVQQKAATHLLNSDPDVAVPVLERIARLPGLNAFDAEMVLREWRAGRLQIP